MSVNKKTKNRKTGPKPKPRNQIKRVLTCTVDPDVFKGLTKYVRGGNFGTRSEAVNSILRKELELCNQN